MDLKHTVLNASERNRLESLKRAVILLEQYIEIRFKPIYDDLRVGLFDILQPTDEEKGFIDSLIEMKKVSILMDRKKEEVCKKHPRI
jgi:hypothetical protein